MTPIDADAAAQLLAQASEAWADRLDLVQTEVGHWSAVFGDGGCFGIDWSEHWGRLVFTGVLCIPSARSERAAMNLALSYNALWREVGNLRMARDTEDGALLLIGELDVQRTAAEALGSALLQFEGLRRRWAEALLATDEAAPDAPPWPLGPFERF